MIDKLFLNRALQIMSTPCPLSFVLIIPLQVKDNNYTGERSRFCTYLVETAAAAPAAAPSTIADLLKGGMRDAMADSKVSKRGVTTPSHGHTPVLPRASLFFSSSPRFHGSRKRCMPPGQPENGMWNMTTAREVEMMKARMR